MDTVKEVLYIIGQALLFVLQEIWEGLKLLGEWIYKWLSEWFSTLHLPTAMKIFGDVNANRALFIAIAAYILFINIRALTLFKKDKQSAKRRQRRVSESKLMKTCLLGGAAGGLIGMNMFRHKTKKVYFHIVFWLSSAIHIFLLFWLVNYL